MESVKSTCNQLKMIAILLATVCLMSGVTHANLLSNGDFNTPNTTDPPADWASWTFGTGPFVNHEFPSTAPSTIGNYDGTYQMSIGGTDTSSGGGIYQTVAATAGETYSLTVDAGAQDWWLPTGEVRLFFLDAADAELDSTVIKTTDSIHDPDLYDVGVPYQTWGFDATAPVGTTQAKVEFAGFGGGTAWFDNASLTVVPEPASLLLASMAGLSIAMGSRRRMR